MRISCCAGKGRLIGRAPIDKNPFHDVNRLDLALLINADFLQIVQEPAFGRPEPPRCLLHQGGHRLMPGTRRLRVDFDGLAKAANEPLQIGLDGGLRPGRCSWRAHASRTRMEDCRAHLVSQAGRNVGGLHPAKVFPFGENLHSGAAFLTNPRINGPLLQFLGHGLVLRLRRTGRTGRSIEACCVEVPCQPVRPPPRCCLGRESSTTACSRRSTSIPGRRRRIRRTPSCRLEAGAASPPAPRPCVSRRKRPGRVAACAAQPGSRKLAPRNPFVESHVNASMEQETPPKDQQLSGGRSSSSSGAGAGRRMTVSGSALTRLESQLLLLDNLQERLPLDDETLPMRKLDPPSWQAAVLPDHPPQDPRGNQECR